MDNYGTRGMSGQGPGDMLAVRAQVKPNPFFCENSDKAHVLVFILEMPTWTRFKNDSKR